MRFFLKSRSMSSFAGWAKPSLKIKILAQRSIESAGLDDRRIESGNFINDIAVLIESRFWCFSH